MYRHSLDLTGNAAEEGDFAQQLFVQKFKERFGVEPTKTSLEEDRLEHKDYKFALRDNKGVIHSSHCDVKAPKRIRREDTEASKDFTWVEFMSKGFPGWIYGKQDWIAFLLPDWQTFLMVKREKLLAVCNALVMQRFVLNSDEAYHKLYCRPETTLGMIDVLSLISYDEIKACEGNWIL